MSQSSENLITVSIYNQNYKIRSGGDAEMIKKISQHVDKTMREIAQRTPTVDTVRVAILAALTIASDYFASQEELEKMQDKVAEKANKLISELRKAQQISAT